MTNGGKKGVSLDSTLVSKAVNALLKHHETTSAKDLLGSEATIHLQVGLVVSPKDPPSKHYNIQLPHAIYKDMSDAEVCLFVKNDETKRQIQELKEQFPELLRPVVKIMTIDSLRSKHGDYGQRRSLLKKYTQFMVDDRIVPLMPSALGRDFIKKSRLPLPIKVTRTKGLPHAIQRALKLTYYTVKGGTCVNVRAAVTTMSADAIAENIIAASKGLHLATKSIQSVCIKLPESAALPLYNQTPEQLFDVIEMARQTEEKVTEETLAVAEEKQKSLKSPLLKALKKQQKLKKGKTKDSDEKEANDAMDVDSGSPAAKTQETSSKKSKNKRPNKEVNPSAESDNDEVVTKQTKKVKSADDDTESPKKTGKKGGSKDPTTPKNSEEDNEERGVVETKKAKSNKSETESAKKTGKERKGAAEEKNDQDRKGSEVSKKRMSKKDDSPSPAKKNKEEVVTDQKAQFVAAKKFTGSKTGYVFKEGSKGLGYYVDEKPVVDKAALDAVLRSLGSSKGPRSRGSSQKRGSSKSRSKSRGSSNDSKRRR